ncbi:restriction endonuclease [Gluconobacter sphaericus]|uniref:restriction endonuclease n=1 Tax=Gluconobacter sphaericus TaxID=574987 RepID=UPI001141ECCB|nr:restriction endonuclease [Gluconobacter sphaericus]MBF0886826.1 restriction endonuclease [Gluconobacter sphaericus]
MRIFSPNETSTADLLVDAVYQGGRQGGAGDDPLPNLVGVSTGGGFRYRGRIDQLQLVVLTSNKRDPDWPDALDRETGVYTYYGDNKTPGRALHETPRRGNALLQRIFEDAQGGEAGRQKVPPVLVFTSAGEWRDMIFLGLGVPGVAGQRPAEDLVAVWRTRNDNRFQNYRARFTILRTENVARTWIESIIAGRPNASLAPPVWTTWVETGRVIPLLAPRTIQHRRRAEQFPSDPIGKEMITIIHSFFADNPHDFEQCAAELARMMVPDIASLDLTRRSRDGGRDGIGQMRIGTGASAILVDFALEAKCYAASHAVGVREMSRLISRLRHRQFGILVTTSCVDEQAYKEIKEDEHPILVISAGDIVRLLKDTGYGTPTAVRSWLERSFPSSL